MGIPPNSNRVVVWMAASGAPNGKTAKWSAMANAEDLKPGRQSAMFRRGIESMHSARSG